MHSNFITPPDLIETVLIVDATQEQIEQCATACRDLARPYNVYFYHKGMEDVNWLVKVVERADTVLQAEDSDVPILTGIRFGAECPLKSPADYFTK
jgi:ornithine cyclodeaminase/alanine dehydrogenase-like protein (mu-crystallin family)